MELLARKIRKSASRPRYVQLPPAVACEKDSTPAPPPEKKRASALSIRERTDPRHQLFLSIDRFPVADCQDQDYQPVVLYLADQPEISDPVTPLPAAVGRQTFAVDPRILTSLKVLLHPLDDHRAYMRIQLRQLFPGQFRELYTVAGHTIPNSALISSIE